MLTRLLAAGVLLAAGNAAWTAWASAPRGPRIGVFVSEAWFDEAGLNPSAYELALVRAGATAVRRRPEQGLEGLDGLVLIGGGDVDPSELELLRQAERRGLPVLGICRGAQAVALAFGGRLEERAGHFLALHPVEIEAGTRTAGLFGTSELSVSSTHRKSIVDPGRLRAAARGADGSIEAVELPGAGFVVGLQWHPEWEGLATPARLAPFRALVAAAKRTG